MSSAKRKMPPASLLQRRVRPRYEPEPESDFEDDVSERPSEEGAGLSGSDDEDDGPSEDGSMSGTDEDSQDEQSGSEEEEDDADDDEEEEDDEDESPHVDASQLSFGALAKAQAAMRAAAKRQRGDSASTERGKEGDWHGHGHPTTLDAGAKKPPKRSSKHAPVEMSSKKPVSRKRDFLTTTAETKKPAPRDPRFMPLGPGGGGGGGSSSTIEEIKTRKAYAFLDEYRESEMRELREAIKKTKDAGARDKLQRALMSMESRKKAQERKDRERAVVEEHRRRERELVRRGKTPFYLKRSEHKKRVLVEQFQGLKKKQVDKAIERRRKKIAGKEKKLLPMARRGPEDR